MTQDITVTDLFCGAGGSSIGATKAGAVLKMAANHWRQLVFGADGVLNRIPDGRAAAEAEREAEEDVKRRRRDEAAAARIAQLRRLQDAPPPSAEALEAFRQAGQRLAEGAA